MNGEPVKKRNQVITVADTATLPSHALLVVLGDLGRSPRMQRHALSLAARGVAVTLLGYSDTLVDPEVEDHPLIRRVALVPPSIRARGRGLAYVMRGLALVVVQAVSLWRLLWSAAASAELLLVQNPPALPVLPVVAVVAGLRRLPWYLDWHNFGAAMLALRIGPRHFAVRLARGIEGISARRATGHLCVSEAMRDALARDWRVTDAVVVRDRPLHRASGVPLGIQAGLLLRLGRCAGLSPVADAPARAAAAACVPDLDADQYDCDRLGDLPTRVPPAWEEAMSELPHPLPLVVAPSSWSADDDWRLLLDACRILDGRVAHHGGGTLFAMVLTGRGPARQAFEEALAGEHFHHLCVATAWLHPDDYRNLLGIADLGLSLHRSASGVDLPIKVVDLFQAGTPVAMLRYGPCIDELVHEGRDAVTFTDAAQLAELLWCLFGEPEGRRRLAEMRSAVQTGELWDQAWRPAARLLLGRSD